MNKRIKIKKESEDIKMEPDERLYVEEVRLNEIPDTSNRNEPSVHQKYKSQVEALNKEKQKLVKDVLSLRNQHQQNYLKLQSESQRADELVTQIRSNKKKENERIDALEKSHHNEIAKKNMQLEHKEERIELLTNELKHERDTVAITTSNVEALERENKILRARVNQLNTGVDSLCAAKKQKNVDKSIQVSMPGNQSDHSSEEDENIFEIDRILAHEVKAKKKLFKIRWKGYSSKWDTWEPEENILDRSILNEYCEKHSLNRTQS